MPEEFQITRREGSNPCGLWREMNQGHIDGIPGRNPPGKQRGALQPPIAVTEICHCCPCPLQPRHSAISRTLEPWKAAPSAAGIGLLWKSGCSRQCHCRLCLAPAPGRIPLPGHGKSLGLLGVQASWTRSAASQELPVPKCGFSLKLKHLRGSPGKLGAAGSQQRLCLERSRLGCHSHGEWWHLVAPRRCQWAEGGREREENLGSC